MPCPTERLGGHVGQRMILKWREFHRDQNGRSEGSRGATKEQEEEEEEEVRELVSRPQLVLFSLLCLWIKNKTTYHEVVRAKGQRKGKWTHEAEVWLVWTRSLTSMNTFSITAANTNCFMSQVSRADANFAAFFKVLWGEVRFSSQIY